MTTEKLLRNVCDYYTRKVTEHGPAHAGVDWNSAESQEMRFDMLLKIVANPTIPFSLNDYGCGYGALAAYVARRGLPCRYAGFDISSAMIEAARKLDGIPDGSKFYQRLEEFPTADYTVASGVFSVKLDATEDDWKQYVLEALEHLASSSGSGFAFNLLTSYSDKNLMRPELYYADPHFYFDYCRERFSRRVAILHDYPIYEFTVLVRLD